MARSRRCIDRISGIAASRLPVVQRAVRGRPDRWSKSGSPRGAAGRWQLGQPTVLAAGGDRSGDSLSGSSTQRQSVRHGGGPACLPARDRAGVGAHGRSPLLLDSPLTVTVVLR
jgi:hypothetical protein